jgi:hypothetical protein
MTERATHSCPYIEYLEEWAFGETDASDEERRAAVTELEEFEQSGKIEGCPSRERLTRSTDVELPFQRIRGALGKPLVRREVSQIFRCPAADFPEASVLNGYNAE